MAASIWTVPPAETSMNAGIDIAIFMLALLKDRRF
jgi:hypothetical protein